MRSQEDHFRTYVKCNNILLPCVGSGHFDGILHCFCAAISKRKSAETFWYNSKEAIEQSCLQNIGLLTFELYWDPCTSAETIASVSQTISLLWHHRKTTKQEPTIGRELANTFC